MFRYLACWTLVSTYAFAQNAGAQTADLVVVNARVHTADPARSSASAIAVRGDRILAVGDDVTSYIGPATRKIDAQGRALIPGWIDSHGHMLGLGLSLIELNLHGQTSEQAIAQQVREAAAKAKPGEWIHGSGWDQNLWSPKQFPTKQSLDEAAPQNPVYLRRVDGHAGWVNSRALDLADVNASTKDPEGGRLIRDSSERPTGVLIDRSQGLVQRKIPALSLEQTKQALERAVQACVKLGLTTVHDAGVDEKTLRAYRALITEDRLPVRIYAMRSVSTLGQAKQLPPPEISDALTVRSIKLYADGALGSRGASLLAPYSDDPNNSGLTITKGDLIEAIARVAHQAGYQVNTHAIGDRANREVLDAYAAVLGGPNDKRFRIEHAQIVSPSDFARFKQYSVIASMQPTHATSDMPWAVNRVGPERILGAYAWHRFLSLGVIVASGSDFPVEDPNPVPGYYAAITRQDRQGNPPGGWMPQERMTRLEALRSWTINGAYAAFEETKKGSLVPGKLADFVILSEDPLQASPEKVLHAKVELTVVGGRVVYQAQ